MKLLLISMLLAGTLGGCVVVPADYGYGYDGGYYEHEHEHHWEGHHEGRDWDRR